MRAATVPTMTRTARAMPSPTDDPLPLPFCALLKAVQEYKRQHVITRFSGILLLMNHIDERGLPSSLVVRAERKNKMQLLS